MILTEETTSDAPSSAPSAKPEAPLGYLADGVTPRKRAVYKKSGGAKPKPASRSKVDYRTTVDDLLTMLALPLTAVPNKAVTADGVALLRHSSSIAAALDTLAKDKPEVAAVLDKLATTSAYGGMVIAVLPLLLQVLANHMVVPVGIAGTVTPDELIASVQPDEPAKQETTS